MDSYLEQYNQQGFFIIKNLIDQEKVELAFREIISSNETQVYHDRNGAIRRIERIYDKGPNLIDINNTFLEELSSIFGEEFCIFKDKFNAKPPQGEGFYAHYDGIFNWKDKSGDLRDGWHIYADEFVNFLVSVDSCTEENGTIEIANIHKGEFEELLENTKKDGTPDLTEIVEKQTKFKKILIDPGDVVIFSSRCPHRSKKNTSSNDRRTIYYTYNPISYGDHYESYFDDKSQSQNTTSKSLSGEL